MMSIKHKQYFLTLTLILIVSSLDFSRGEDDGKAGEKPKAIDEWETEEPHYDAPEWEGPQGVQTLEFGGGNLNDGDKWSSHMPMELKCDGCRAIAYAIKQKLKRYQKRYRQRHILSESDIVELMDQVCHNTDKDFDGYGLKEILGIRRLSGPGLETKEVPGVSHGGGRWPYRLQQMCQEYVEEIGEYRIYKQFLKHKSMENVLCRNKKSELGWICPRKKKKKKKDPEEEGDETGSQAAPEGSEQTQDAHASSTDSGQPSEKPAESSTETKPDQTQAGQDSNQPQSENTQSGENAQQNEESKPQQGSDKPEDVKKPEEKKSDEKKSKENAKKSEKDGTKVDQDLKPKDENIEKPKEDDEKGKGDTGLPNGAFETPYDEAPKAAKKPKSSNQQDEKRNTDSTLPKEDAKETQPKENKKSVKEEL